MIPKYSSYKTRNTLAHISNPYNPPPKKGEKNNIRKTFRKVVTITTQWF
jgi:hypothetical protein